MLTVMSASRPRRNWRLRKTYRDQKRGKTGYLCENPVFLRLSITSEKSTRELHGRRQLKRARTERRGCRSENTTNLSASLFRRVAQSCIEIAIGRLRTPSVRNLFRCDLYRANGRTNMMFCSETTTKLAETCSSKLSPIQIEDRCGSQSDSFMTTGDSSGTPPPPTSLSSQLVSQTVRTLTCCWPWV